MKKGYTLIELVTVMGILVVISNIIIGIVYTTLRGSNKTRITTTVAQNGNYALSVISNTITTSESVIKINDTDISDCTTSPSGQTIDLIRYDGGVTTLSCLNSTIASSSGSLAEPLVDLIDKSQVENDSSTCYFKCIQSESDPYSVPTVEYSFTLSDKNAAGGLFETKSQATFKSSTSLRNYNP
ncbi:MAG: hypothetical protein AUK12_04025 [Candidatus Levybacteria bacterium CG2_30_37_29]|nr:MAG: hypothetical protein AUK12_04025 [Candidatus Levybacteria bacterium CG2_30_37_29]